MGNTDAYIITPFLALVTFLLYHQYWISVLERRCRKLKATVIRLMKDRSDDEETN